MTSQFRRERHSITDLKIHLVCVTKYRRSVFTKESLELIDKTFREVAKKMDFQVIEFNGEDNHVHALIEYPPKLSISQIVNALKGVSSRRYGQAGYKKPQKECEFAGGILPPATRAALWSPSYFAVSVGGAPLDVLKEYIRNQEKPS
ncbi:IS200/IS605 family transposase [aff. Roholtiella sp. LEGE 12411]|uniref:IS200/IS605 family transposase n=1 Tax=aff. Roholtiella sp. LEGE 12411 TaxID=1828822 RepID=UPI001882085A|nr:IS200/IS605 family transposase [aff. Roholtiella sp. LEGE 12411]MBE9038893.1 IS200/IS605 family transposase [aff. Roholtiella sp. LEGE 12411]